MNTPNPYESQRKITAYYNAENDTFSLHGKTYHSRERLKSMGGKWDGLKWSVPLSSAEELSKMGVLLMVKCKVDKHCHMDIETHYNTHKEVLCGYTREGCPKCDTPATCGDDVKILEILDENIDKYGQHFGITKEVINGFKQ